MGTELFCKSLPPRIIHLIVRLDALLNALDVPFFTKSLEIDLV